MDSNQLRQTLIGIAIGAALTGGAVLVRNAQSPALPTAAVSPAVTPAPALPVPAAEVASTRNGSALADFAAIAADNGAAV